MTKDMAKRREGSAEGSGAKHAKPAKAPKRSSDGASLKVAKRSSDAATLKAPKKAAADKPQPEEVRSATLGATDPAYAAPAAVEADKGAPTEEDVTFRSLVRPWMLKRHGSIVERERKSKGRQGE